MCKSQNLPGVWPQLGAETPGPRKPSGSLRIAHGPRQAAPRASSGIPDCKLARVGAWPSSAPGVAGAIQEHLWEAGRNGPRGGRGARPVRVGSGILGQVVRPLAFPPRVFWLRFQNKLRRMFLQLGRKMGESLRGLFMLHDFLCP